MCLDGISTNDSLPSRLLAEALYRGSLPLRRCFIIYIHLRALSRRTSCKSLSQRKLSIVAYRCQSRLTESSLVLEKEDVQRSSSMGLIAPHSTTRKDEELTAATMYLQREQTRSLLEQQTTILSGFRTQRLRHFSVKT
jgi:hypothetical protein